MFGYTLLGMLALIACNPDKKDLDEDGFVGAEDCDDGDASIHPDAAEVCDGLDNDCDGGIDNDATDATTWYADADADGYGGALTLVDCEQPSGYLETSDDCDDLDAAVNPAASEICDGIDNDCDTLVDADDDSVDLSTASTWYADVDGDGFGDDSASQESCDQPGGTVEVGGDCDDGNADINPETRWHEDTDGDGYGSAEYFVESCEEVSGYVVDDADCDDLDATVNPDGAEVCDDADNDCDGLWNDDDDSVDVTTMSDWYTDVDGDGYGDESSEAVVQCAQPSSSSLDNTDCDDTESSTNPGEIEVCDDGVDNDCSGDAPECGIGASAAMADASAVGEGENASDYYGRSVAVLDFDGDGMADVAGGAYGNDDNGTSSGAVYLNYGSMTTLDADGAGATFLGDSSYDYAGYVMDSAGDTDGDGADELLVGGYYAGYGYGHAWLVYGGTTSGDLSSVAPSWYGESSYDYLGLAVGGIGDVNADGYDDIAIAAPYDDTNASNAGAVYIVYGSASALSGSQSLGDADEVVYGASYYSNLGYNSSIGGGDIDGDGAAEFVIGEGSYYGPSGTLYVYNGGTSASFGSTGSADASFAGNESYFGAKPSMADDLDQDGYNDLVTADRYDGSYYGMVYVFQGSASGFSGSYTTADAYADITGENSYDYMGWTVDVADIDGDSNADIITGSYGWDDSTSGSYSNGKVYVFSGPVTGGSVLASAADSSVQGDAGYDYVGYSVGTGDVDGDGIHDLAIGAHGSNSYAGGISLFNGGGM